MLTRSCQSRRRPCRHHGGVRDAEVIVEELRFREAMAATVGSTAGSTSSPESLAPRRDTVAAALLQRMGATVWEADGRTWQFKYVSAEAEQLLGYPVEQWLTQADFWSAHVHPEDVDWAVEFCLDATASGRDHT